MLKKVIVCLALLPVLTGCFNSLDARELLLPPRLTSEQSQIYDALAAAIGTDSFKFKYPQSGEYLSACILHDIDRDGVEEAIAFYELTTVGDTSTWMSIMEQKESGWISVKEIPGLGSEIDMVSFDPITSQDTDNIIVGWSSSDLENNLCVIYEYEEDDLAPAHTSELWYDSILIENMDDNDLSELVLATKLSSNQSSMELVKYRKGRVVTTSQVDMPAGIEEYIQLTYGALNDNISAIFTDILLKRGTTITKIAVVDNSIIKELTPEDLGIYEELERPNSNITTQDINGDGLIDIPVSFPLLGYEEAEPEELISRIEYLSLLNGSIQTVQNIIPNPEEEYLLTIPPAWVGRVTVKVHPTTGEWRFCIFDGDVESSTVELLRIKVTAPSDYQDKLETVEYRTITTRGENVYQAYIPPASYPGLSISYDQLNELFSLT